jgi:diketogulonate reductase-like aldo/keto reductase
MKRRDLLALAPGLLGLPHLPAHAAVPRLMRELPRGGQAIPAIGLGTWLTFDVRDDLPAQAQRGEVLRRFFAAGGGMVDSSPMYGDAERLMGALLQARPPTAPLIAASKVWTPFERLGPGQLERSLALWGLPRFDVLLVHNLLNWRDHLPLLRAWKAEGRVRHIGISTSHGRAHDEVAQLLRSEPMDVLQLTYNIAHTDAEPLLDLALDKGVAVVVNRPMDGGSLFNRVQGQPLPAWAAEADIANWAQFFLKWIVAHPAVTCAIPATRVPGHLDQNMGASLGRQPDAALRKRMTAHYGSL